VVTTSFAANRIVWTICDTMKSKKKMS